MPEVTVVITTHNLAYYLEQCLNDLYFQTMQSFDILLVDDKSTDSTREVVENWKHKFFDRLNTIYLNENKGKASLVRNEALNSGLIQGNYIVFLDGDDRLEPNFIETLYNNAYSNDADISMCAYDRVDIDTGKQFAIEMKKFGNVVIHNPMESDIVAFYNTAPWNKMWKREIIENIRFAPIKVGEEISFDIQAYISSKSIVLSEDVLIHYMVRRESAISNTKENDIWDLERELNKLYRSVQNEYKNIVEFVIFFHMGLSMALRASDNRDIDIRKHIARTRTIFEEYHWFKENPFFRLTSLLKHGVKGLIIWFAFVAYRMNFFFIILEIYRKLHLNIKF